MKAVILAAGYATRLRPLTDDVPKPLLPVGGRPILDWILGEHRRGRRDRRDPRGHEQRASSPAVRRVGATAATSSSTTTARASNEDRLGAIGDLQFVLDRAGIDDDLLVDRRRQPVRVQPRRLRRVLARARATRARSPSATAAISSSRAGYGIVELDADDRIDVLRREAGRPAVDARRDRRRTSTAARTLPLDRRVPRRGQRARPAGQPRRLAPRREPVYGYRFDGELVRHRRPRAAARGRQPAARRAARPARRAPRTRRRARRHDSVTELTQTRHGFGRTVGRVAARPPLPAALRRLRRGLRDRRSARACRRVARGRSCRRWCALLRRADRLAGRALPRVRRAAARVRLGPRGGRLRGAGAAVRARLEGARPPPRRRPGRRARRRAHRRAGGRRHHVYPAATTAGSSTRGHHPAERARARPRRALGTRRRGAARPRHGASSARPGCRSRERRRNVAARSGPRRDGPGDGSCSSTTSTRPARPRARGRRRRCGAAGARARRGRSPSPVRSARLRSSDGSTTTEGGGMRLQVKGKNVEVTPSMREYAERKLAKLAKQLAEPDAGRGRALRAAEPVDRRQPRRRGDDLHQRARRCGPARRRPT